MIFAGREEAVQVPRGISDSRNETKRGLHEQNDAGAHRDNAQPVRLHTLLGQVVLVPMSSCSVMGRLRNVVRVQRTAVTESRLPLQEEMAALLPYPILWIDSVSVLVVAVYRAWNAV